MVLNKPNREGPVMAAIRDEALRARPDVKFRIVPYEAMFDGSALAFRPDVVVTFPLTGIGSADLIYPFKWHYKAAVISLRAEGVVNPDSESNIADHIGYDRYGPHLVDWEVFWGPGMTEIVGGALLRQKKLSSPERLLYFGYPRLERYFRQPEMSADPVSGEVQRRIASSGARHRVLFVTGFHLGNYSREDLYAAQDLDAENREQELLQMVRETQAFRGAFIEGVLASASRHPEILFVLKKHPTERREDYARLEGVSNVLYVWQDVDVADLMQHASLFVHYGSTTLADAYLARVASIYVHAETALARKVYNNMGWPSTRTVSVSGLPGAIDDFAAGGLRFEITREITDMLAFHFNIRLGQPYRPARELAELLLDPGAPQRVRLTDRHFVSALGKHAYRRARRAIGRPIRRLLNRLSTRPVR